MQMEGGILQEIIGQSIDAVVRQINYLQKQRGGLTLWLKLLKALKTASKRLVGRKQRQVRLAGSNRGD